MRVKSHTLNSMIELNTPEYRKIAFGLALGSFIVFCNLYVVQPMLPFMAAHFSISSTTANWLFASATLALSLCLVPWAIASERFGRRRILFIGLISLPIVSLAMSVNGSWWMLLTGRAVIGVAIAAFASVAVAYMVEELSPSAFSAAIGSYIAANSLGGISGRIIGGTLTDSLGWQGALIVVGALSTIGVAITYKLVPAQRNFEPKRQGFAQHNRSIITHIRTPIVWVAMLIGGVNFALFVNLYSVMGFRLVAPPYSLPISLVSLIFICYLGGTISSKLTTNWRHHFSEISGMLVGSSISLFGMVVALYPHLSAMLLGLCCISFGAFFTHTLAYGWVSQHAKTAKATATALYLVHYYIGGSIGGFFLLLCWQHGGWASVVVGGSVLFALLFVLILRLRYLSYEPKTMKSHTNA